MNMRKDVILGSITVSVAVATICGLGYVGIKSVPTSTTKTTTYSSSKGVVSITDMAKQVYDLRNAVTTYMSDKLAECVITADVPVFDWDVLGNELPTINGDNTITVSEEILDTIRSKCNEFDVPYDLALSVCYVESGFRGNVNNAGLNSDGTTDYGIMGLNDKYLSYNCDLYNDGVLIDPYDVEDNVHIGVQILANNLEYFDGNIYDAACSYNLGTAGWNRKKAKGDTWYYGDKVMTYSTMLKEAITVC